MAADDCERWDAKYRDPERGVGAPSAFLASCLEHLPRRGRCLDVAGGSGRNALVLARHGLQVTILDVSQAGLALARDRALEAELELETLCRDIAEAGLPAGPFDVVVCVHFQLRGLFAEWPSALVPDGMLVFEHPTRTNLQRHPRPPLAYTLEDDELPGLVSGLDILRYAEGWDADGRHTARLLARKRSGA